MKSWLAGRQTQVSGSEEGNLQLWEEGHRTKLADTCDFNGRLEKSKPR